MITPQKAHSVLRRAGFYRSEWYPSSAIRGWGEWSPGYHVKPHWDSSLIDVSYNAGIHARTYQGDHLERMAVALSAAGIESRRMIDPQTGWPFVRINEQE